MSLKIQASFSSGELDPALHERTNLEKYHSALATARNVVVGKTGRLVSRPGRKLFRKTKLSGRKIIIHPLTSDGSFLEFGHLYYRHWSIAPKRTNRRQLYGQATHAITEDQLPYVSFVDVAAGKVLVFLSGVAVQMIEIGQYVNLDTGFKTAADIFSVPAAPTSPTVTAGTTPPTGYDVDYAITFFYGGEESAAVTVASGKIPILAAETNSVAVDCGLASTVSAKAQEIRVYRRPRAGGAYGYIGSASSFATVATKYIGTFVDHGQAADYGHLPPEFNQGMRDLGFADPIELLGLSGCMYQQRLLMSYQDKIFTSRTGFPFNFTRDYPLSSDSSLSLKMGTKGNINIIKMINSDGLVVFTHDGVYLHTGALSPSNMSLEKKGSWIIDLIVPPIAIPGGVLFVDSLTNTVRQLLWSQEAGTYIAEEMSIFSNHLFENVTIKSWAFQDGVFPLLWIVFSDGTYASFTYEREHQMRAWTRHDSGFDLEYVATTAKSAVFNYTSVIPTDGQILFVTNVNGQRYIETGVQRYATPEEQAASFQSDMNSNIAAMDGMVTWKYWINERRISFVTGLPAALTLTANTPNTWDGPLTLTCSNVPMFDATPVSDGTLFEVGTIFRHFHPVDGSAVDLEITSISSDYIAIVQPTTEFPSDYASGVQLYLTTNVVGPILDSWIYSTLEYYGSMMNVEKRAHADLAETVHFVTTAKVAGVWDGTLIIDTGAQVFWRAADNFYVNDLFYYKTNAGTWIEMQITAITSNFIVEVMPSSTFPSGEGSEPTYYFHTRFMCTLDHLEGESVSVISDGYVIASPNNNIDNYDVATVTSGSLTLPNSLRGAIIHIGRPYTMDVETLDIDTVEQHPVLLESKTINKLYIKVLNSRGLFVSSKFPATDVLTGMSTSGLEEVTMEDTDTIPIDYEDPIIANRYPRPRTKRVEITLPGDWKSQGRICARQVDPIHFEILSITPDLEELIRSR